MTCMLPTDALTRAIWSFIPFIAIAMIGYLIYKSWTDPEESFIMKVFDISICMILIGTILAMSINVFFGMGC